jgi:hypothetical protein
MYQRDRKISKYDSKEVRKLLGGSYVDSLAISFRKDFTAFGDDILPYLQDSHSRFFSPKGREDAMKYEKLYPGLDGLSSDIESSMIRFNHSCDTNLHLAICGEITQFLQTRTSGYFWRNFVPCLVGGVLFAIKNGISHKKSAYIKDCVKDILHKNDTYVTCVLSSIVSTHWIDQISQELGSAQKIYFSK